MTAEPSQMSALRIIDDAPIRSEHDGSGTYRAIIEPSDGRSASWVSHRVLHTGQELSRSCPDHEETIIVLSGNALIRTDDGVSGEIADDDCVSIPAGVAYTVKAVGDLDNGRGVPVPLVWAPKFVAVFVGIPAGAERRVRGC